MSSKKNRKIREALERIYGEGCMFQKARIEQRIEELGGIKTYKQFKEEHKYTLKKIKAFENIQTLHHLVHKSEKGQTTIENGAVVNSLAHTYLHSLPRADEEKINDMLREYKKCKVEFVDDLDTEIEVKTVLIKPSSLSKSEKIDRERRKKDKEWKRIKKEWEDR